MAEITRVDVRKANLKSLVVPRRKQWQFYQVPRKIIAFIEHPQANFIVLCVIFVLIPNTNLFNTWPAENINLKNRAPKERKPKIKNEIKSCVSSRLNSKRQFMCTSIKVSELRKNEIVF